MKKNLASVCVLVSMSIAAIPALDHAAAQGAGKIDGKWMVARQEEKGGLVPAIVSKRFSMVIDGGKMSWYIGNPAPNLTADLAFDEAKKTVDAKITRGMSIGKSWLGIYKLDKDVLEICWGEPGSDKRPEKFTSKPGAGGGAYHIIYTREGAKVDLKLPDKDPIKQPPVLAKKDIRMLQVKLADKWKDDGAFVGIRLFSKGKSEFFGEIHDGPMPATPEALADLAKKKPNLFPSRTWLKTTGIGKFADGVFIIGQSKAASEQTSIGIARNVEGTTVLFFGAPADDAAARKEMLEMCRSARFEGPADWVFKGARKKVKLNELKFELPKGWEAKHMSGSNEWKISKDAPPDYPDIYVGWILDIRVPKSLDEYVAKAMKGPDHFAFGWHFASVSEKGMLPDGMYMVGKVKLKSDKEAKRTAFSIMRDLGAESGNVVFECYNSESEAERKQAMAICKSAKFP